MVDFRAIIDNLIGIGFYSVILPFLLVYAVSYAILQKANLFKGGSSTENDTKNVNAIIAFVFALFAVASIQTIRFIENFILNAVIGMIFILTVLIILGFVFGEEYKEIFKNKYVKWGLSGLITIILISLFLEMIGFWEAVEDFFSSSSGFFQSETISTIIVLLLVGGVLYWITKSDTKKEDKK